MIHTGDGSCARCEKAVSGRHLRYSLRDRHGFKFTIWLHRHCAVAYANTLMRDGTKQEREFMATERQQRETLQRIIEPEDRVQTFSVDDDGNPVAGVPDFPG